jgi:thioredoxin domain-containing protein 10
MGVLARAMRMYYEATTTLSGMWYGNPVLTSVIIGLPLGFLSLICYSMWCADIMDASEDEQSKISGTLDRRWWWCKRL